VREGEGERECEREREKEREGEREREICMDNPTILSEFTTRHHWVEQKLSLVLSRLLLFDFPQVILYSLSVG
jgi:hypothetical protein